MVFILQTASHACLNIQANLCHTSLSCHSVACASCCHPGHLIVADKWLDGRSPQWNRCGGFSDQNHADPNPRQWYLWSLLYQAYEYLASCPFCSLSIGFLSFGCSIGWPHVRQQWIHCPNNFWFCICTQCPSIAMLCSQTSSLLATQVNQVTSCNFIMKMQV